ncbi:hypothetical protein [Streptacidiphilus sp. P02-A3a]|uniref:hypothetical protein n=1 Tax=Streptacidiphilus sp. P02-A3a TaxID=2704468 RepID=UPI0015FAC2F9|nr:hypothetical protein [Streptacidiphilus sp. P02-A3a]QMU68777.1 hypothetical protein GXP74_11580 [Streptacidiphilus sp. P02-A3a]
MTRAGFSSGQVWLVSSCWTRWGSTGSPPGRRPPGWACGRARCTGFVLQEQALPPVAAESLPELGPERCRNLWEWQAGEPASKDAAFAAGLSLIVRGLRAELDESGSSSSSPLGR